MAFFDFSNRQSEMIKKLFDYGNREVLLDVIVFLVNLILMTILSRQLANLFREANTPNQSADYFGLPPRIFTLLFLGIPALAIANTFIVYFYFQAPKHKPILPWLESTRSEIFGDIFLYLNMIGFQAFWGLLMADLTNDYSTVAGRLAMFAFVTLLIYIPPRLFYLAEDGNRPVVWLTMLLANSPILLRILFISSAKATRIWQ